MKMLALILLTGITTNPTSVMTRLESSETFDRTDRQKDSTSLSPLYRLPNTDPNQAVDVDALFWTRKVNDLLRSKLINTRQPIANLICFFHVLKNGRVVGPVTFSRKLEPREAKRITNEILQLSPLPALTGQSLHLHSLRKVYFEIARNGDTALGFAK